MSVLCQTQTCVYRIRSCQRTTVLLVGRIVHAKRLKIIRIAFARLYSSGLPECEANNSDQGEKCQKLGEPDGHWVVLLYAVFSANGSPSSRTNAGTRSCGLIFR